jgi:hypothetical protein
MSDEQNYNAEDEARKLVEAAEGPVQVEEAKITSLGKAQKFTHTEESPLAGDIGWKNLPFKNLPSQGLFYFENSEMLLRSAKTKEIRHWSTIDEDDPVDVREKINFILNSLMRFSITGRAIPLSHFDITEIDKYHILFRIHELTFPNQENKLWANVKCKNAECGHINRVHVASGNLVGFEIPEELEKWYSPEERCFVIESPKLGETLRFYMPTIGMQNKFRTKKKQDADSGQKADDAFYEMGPYLFRDWKTLSQEEIGRLKIESADWQINKFTIVHKVIESLKNSSTNKVGCICEKCKQSMESSIFLGGSFTAKDIFVISAGLDELI